MLGYPYQLPAATHRVTAAQDSESIWVPAGTAGEDRTCQLDPSNRKNSGFEEAAVFASMQKVALTHDNAGNMAPPLLASYDAGSAGPKRGTPPLNSTVSLEIAKQSPGAQQDPPPLLMKDPGGGTLP